MMTLHLKEVILFNGAKFSQICMYVFFHSLLKCCASSGIKIWIIHYIPN